MSRYQRQYEIKLKGSCGNPKVITQDQYDKYIKSGLIRRFNVKELPAPVEPPPIDDSGDGDVVKKK